MLLNRIRSAQQSFLTSARNAPRAQALIVVALLVCFALAGAAAARSRDKTPPSAAQYLSSTSATQSAVTLDWRAATDNRGVMGYEIYRNTVRTGTTRFTRYTVGGLLCGTSYKFDVRAYDAAGNRSAFATVFAPTKPCNTTPPSVNPPPVNPPPVNPPPVNPPPVSPPTDGSAPTAPTGLLQQSSTQTSTVVVWQPSSDNVGVTGYDVSQGTVPLGQTASPAYTISGLTCGTSYTVNVDARDAAGNVSAETQLTIATASCPPASSSADLYVAPTGSDGNPCSQTSPCVTLNRAYRLAKPGQVVQVAGGTYGAQTISADSTKTATHVVIRSAAGAVASFGHVDVYGGHITFEQLNFPSGWTVWDGVSDLTFLNTTGSYLYIFGGQNVSVIGGSYGPTVDTYSFISATAPGAPVPTNILIDGVTFHDYSRSSSTSHTECLHAVSVQNLTIRNSHFERCAVMDLFLTINPNSPQPFRNLTIENNFFGRTTSGGYYSVFFDSRVGFDTVNFRYNSLAQSPIIEAGSNLLNNFLVEGNLGEQWSFQCNSRVTYSHNVWFDGASPDSTVAKCGATDVGYEAMADPGWVDQTGVDLHLKAGSPLAIAGAASGFPTTDIDGQTRTSPTSVGADQP